MQMSPETTCNLICIFNYFSITILIDLCDNIIYHSAATSQRFVSGFNVSLISVAKHLREDGVNHCQFN